MMMSLPILRERESELSLKYQIVIQRLTVMAHYKLISGEVHI